MRTSFPANSEPVVMHFVPSSSSSSSSSSYLKSHLLSTKFAFKLLNRTFSIYILALGTIKQAFSEFNST
jgi:hypothetical protein